MAWHRAYDDPAGMQARRLAAVTAMLVDAVAAVPPGPVRVLSLCSGDGRDLTGALTGHPRAPDVTGLLVEADPTLAARAEANLAGTGTPLEVRCADAGDPATFARAVPADIVLLAGIFGNVEVADVATTVAATPALCRPGATVIWTRHRRHPDVTPWIRQRFDDAGCPAVAFESPGPGGYGLGRQRYAGTATPALPPLPAGRLFTFTTTAEAWGGAPGAGRR